jgi:hypothetical protein
MAKARTVPASEPTTTYLIETKDEWVEMTVPSTWKVTFGPMAPGSSAHYDKVGLRFYEAENKQRAYVPDVRSFRDLSIVRRASTKGAVSPPTKVAVGLAF